MSHILQVIQRFFAFRSECVKMNESSGSLDQYVWHDAVMCMMCWVMSHMHAHICMRTFPHTNLQPNTLTYTHTYHAYTQTYPPTREQTYLHTYIRICLPTDQPTKKQTYRHTHTQTYIETYIQTNIHTFIHTCIHTRYFCCRLLTTVRVRACVHACMRVVCVCCACAVHRANSRRARSRIYLGHESKRIT